MNSCFFIALSSEIKLFIELSAIIGPLAILGVVLLLKRIEKDNPEKIRWR